MSERVVEYPFLRKHIRLDTKILDIGSGVHPKEWSVGFLLKEGAKDVVALDPDMEPDFEAPYRQVRDSATKQYIFGKGEFGAVTCVSTLEHIMADPQKIVENIHYWLKSEGTLILTVPAGIYGMYFHRYCGDMRLFDVEKLESLFKPEQWKLLDMQFYTGAENEWKPCERDDVKNGKPSPVTHVILAAYQRI